MINKQDFKWVYDNVIFINEIVGIVNKYGNYKPTEFFIKCYNTGSVHYLICELEYEEEKDYNKYKEILLSLTGASFKELK